MVILQISKIPFNSSIDFAKITRLTALSMIIPVMESQIKIKLAKNPYVMIYKRLYNG